MVNVLRSALRVPHSEFSVVAKRGTGSGERGSSQLRYVLLIALVCSLAAPAIAQEPTDDRKVAKPAIKKIDGARRARILSAFAGLLILGGAMIVLTWMYGRMTRRMMRSSISKLPPTDQQLLTDDWAVRPLSDEERRRLDEEDLLG